MRSRLLKPTAPVSVGTRPSNTVIASLMIFPKKLKMQFNMNISKYVIPTVQNWKKHLPQKKSKSLRNHSFVKGFWCVLHLQVLLPVIYPANGEARKATAEAISSGKANLLKGFEIAQRTIDSSHCAYATTTLWR
ncbi:MAG: hypothetical protein U0T81_16850 [Saprospiraceae bacterium]